MGKFVVENVTNYKYECVFNKSMEALTKINLKCDNVLWKKVLKYKIDHDLKNNNEAVIELVKKGLQKK